MKKIVSILIIAVVIVTLGMVSCKKDKKEDTTPEPNKTYSELIVGRWKTADEGHFEVYNSNGTGHMWDPADDVQEDEADTFTWSIDSNNKLTQIITYQNGSGVIPQYCNILKLNATTFKYNNEGWRAEYTLVRE